MAKVLLTGYEARSGDLPSICVRCGAPATVDVDHTFEWHPLWVDLIALCGPIPGAIARGLVGQEMRAVLPFCIRHESHLRWGNRVWWFGVLLGFGLVVGLLLLLLAIDEPVRARYPELITPLVLIELLAILMITHPPNLGPLLVRGLMVFATWIDDDSIVLANVSEDFDSC